MRRDARGSGAGCSAMRGAQALVALPIGLACFALALQVRVGDISTSEKVLLHVDLKRGARLSCAEAAVRTCDNVVLSYVMLRPVSECRCRRGRLGHSR